MVEQSFFLEEETKYKLDYMLENGFFRMGQSVFTSNYGIINSKFYSYIWLRYVLEKHTESLTVKKLKNRNKHFKVVCKKAVIDDEREHLYYTYKKSISFNTHTSIENMLLGYPAQERDHFDTYELCVYDNHKMIACSYFDIGVHSAEGIASFYDPAYKQYSLGKYAIVMQIETCKQMGLRYFYPGYFIPGYAHFDYKLTLSKNSSEYYDSTTQLWYPIETYCDKGLPLHFGITSRFIAYLNNK